MRVIAVDDEPMSLEYLSVILSDTPEIDEVVSFTNAHDALSWLKGNSADIAFLDIMMTQMNGLELAEQIGQIQKNCNVVFVTGSTDYAVEAFRLHATGYIVKPATVEGVRREIEHIRKLYPETTKTNSLRIQCFGNFDVFYDDLPLKFRYHKTKELLAYLVHRRGVAVSVRELVAILYEDRADSESLQSQLRTLISDLYRTLNECGCGDVLVRARGTVAIAPYRVSCDYFDYIAGNTEVAKSYMGEYMAQYDWADYMSVRLDQQRF